MLHAKVKEGQSPTGVPLWLEHLSKEGLVEFVAGLVLAPCAPVPLETRADPRDWALQPAPDGCFCWVQDAFGVGGYSWRVLGLTSLDGVPMFALPPAGVMIFIGVPFIGRHRERPLLKRPVMLATLLFGSVFFGCFTANRSHPHKKLGAAEPMAIDISSCTTCHTVGPLGNQTGCTSCLMADASVLRP